MWVLKLSEVYQIPVYIVVKILSDTQKFDLMLDNIGKDLSIDKSDFADIRKKPRYCNIFLEVDTAYKQLKTYKNKYD